MPTVRQTWPSGSTPVAVSPGAQPLPSTPTPSGPNKKVIAAVIVTVLIVGGAAAAFMMGAFAGPGQCVLQEVDSQGTVHYTRGENYSPSECAAYCEAHLPPNGGARGCWFDEY